MNESLNNPEPEVGLPIIDLSQKFLTMKPAILFIGELDGYRRKPVHLHISIPWDGDKFKAIRLKAFIEGNERKQKRTAKIVGTREEREQAVKISDVANVLNSGVKWEFTD